MGTLLESVEELHDGRRGAADEKGVVRFVKRWRVRTLSKQIGPIGVVSSANQYHGIPVRGTYYLERDGQFNALARCVSLSCDPSNKHPRDFIIACEFTTAPPDARLQAEMGKPGTGGTPRSGGLADKVKNGAGLAGGYEPGARPDDPIFHPATITFSTIRKREAMARADRYSDAAGVGNLQRVDFDVRPANVVGDEYDPKPEWERRVARFTITRAERNFDWQLMLDNVGCLNDSTWLSRPAYTWLMDDISCTEEFDKLYGYWRVTYTLCYDPLGWPVQILESGYRKYKAPPGDKTKQGILINGHVPAHPVPLDWDGKVLPDGQTPKYSAYWPKGYVCNFDGFQLV